MSNYTATIGFVLRPTSWDVGVFGSDDEIGTDQREACTVIDEGAFVLPRDERTPRSID